MSDCYDNGTGLRGTMRHNLGRVCTIHTDSGDCFTGILSEVGVNSCKLITLNSDNGPRCAPDYCEGERRVRTIPIDKIDCLSTSQY